MYCSECGKKIDTGNDEICPECRKKLEEERKQFILIGERRGGNTRLSKIRYESQVLICRDQIEVNTKTDWMEKKEYTFNKEEIADIRGKVKPMWSVGDVIRFLIFGLLIPVTNLQSIWGIFLSVKLMLCNCIEISLKDGRKVCIPVMQYADINPVMQEIGGQQEKIQQFSEKQIPENKWVKRNTISTYILFAVAAIMIVYGIEQVENGKTFLTSNSNDNSLSKEARKTFDILQKNMGLEKDENEQGDVEKYIFPYEGKWSLEYVKEKVFVRFISQDVYDCFAGRFSEDAIKYAGQFAYGFDDTTVNIYTDIDLGEEGNLSIVTYDLQNQSYILMVDGEKCDISDSFRDYLNEYGLPEILQSAIDGFEADMEAMGLTKSALESLSLDGITQLVAENKIDVETVSQEEEKQETEKIQAKKETEVQTETQQITEVSESDYYSAYSGILSDTKNEYGDAGSYCTYALYDIDGDGVKELITGEGTCSADWGNYVYSISSNGVYCAGYFDKTVLLYAADDGNGIYAVWGMQGVEQVRRITLNEGKVKEEEILSRQIKPDYESYITYPIEIQTAYMTDFSLLIQNQETQVSGESQPEEIQEDGDSDYYSEAEYLEVTEEDLRRRPEQYEDMDIKVLNGAYFVDEDGFDTMESIQVQYYGKAYDKAGEIIGNILGGDKCWVEGQFLSYTKDDGTKEWYIAAHKVIVVDDSEYWKQN